MGVTAVILGFRPETDQGAWVESGVGRTFATSVIASIVGFIAVRRQSHRVSQLENEKADALANEEVARTSLVALVEDYSRMSEYQLSALANSSSLNFSFTERISVYKHDGKAFVMTGRYSRDPDFNKRGRVVYTDNEGCIGRAWHTGEAFEANLPDPAVDLEAYVERVASDWGMPMNVARELRMKSRSLAAFAITDPRGDRPIAVIVFESIRTDVLELEKLRRVLNGVEGRRLTGFIDVMRPIEPSLAYASQEGF